MLRLAQSFVERQAEGFGRQISEAMAGQAQGDQLVLAWQGFSGQPLLKRVEHAMQWLRGSALPVVTRQRAERVLGKISDRAKDIYADWAEMLTDEPLIREAMMRGDAAQFRDGELRTIVKWCARQGEEVVRDEGDSELDPERDPYRSVDGRDERLQTMAGRIDPPDDGLMVYLALLKWGELRTMSGKKTIRYEHVVVDEAQDLTAVEIRVLISAAGKRCSVTLAGDTAQRVVFDNAFESWEQLLDQLHLPVTSNTTLRLGYRSTAEVMALAESFINHAENRTQVTRSGAPVELLRFPDQGQAVGMLAEALRSLERREPLASVALITRHAAQAQRYADALRRAEVPNVRWVQQQNFSFRAGVEIVDIQQVKGLEFDYVILLDVNHSQYPNTLESRHLLHIGATRAVHQLWLVTTGIPSPLLPSAA